MNNSVEPAQRSDDKDGPNDGDTTGNNKINRPPYNLNSILHYLQHEINRFEMERAHWQMEKSELKARIKFLNGERRSQEELKKDLVRRIKMLEYSLKQERAKLQRLKGELKPDQQAEEEEPHLPEENYGMIEVDAIVPSIQSSQIYTKARTMLRQYLEEIGYSEKVLDVRAFRVKSLLGLMPENDGIHNERYRQKSPDIGSKNKGQKALNESEQAVLDAADIIRGKKHSSNNGRINGGDSDLDNENLDLEAVTALDEFSFLKDEKSSLNETIIPVNQTTARQQNTSNEEWNVDPNRIKQMAEIYRSEKERKRTNSTSSTETPDTVIDYYATDKGRKPDMDDINIKDNFADTNDSPSIQWKIRFTLRSHLDSVRAMQFHPFEPVLITASEDSTCKMWTLDEKGFDNVLKNRSFDSHGIMDLEPKYTFRGHKGPVLSMDMSSTGEMFFTGGHDGEICCWELPDFNIAVYDHYDRRLMTERFKGHKDAVWSVVYQSSLNRIISGSADNTVRIWELGSTRDDQSGEPQLKLYEAPPNARLRSIDLVSTESNQLLTAYSGQLAGILDLETDQRILDFNLKDLDEEVGEINKIISHPTMNVSIMAGTDRRIRYFDNSTVAHVESISTISADPNGLVLLSGSVDGSIRVWNMETKVCLQEIAAHRKKYDMSVLSVGFHPSRPLVGSSGADSLVKIFSSTE
ncbi:hypothetical protein M3Y97_00219300 [Aphelenchoides bicaudatus]|nr:hypothetical protein M3Y97_00219300 [Aphelenchoides bicaudatus]